MVPSLRGQQTSVQRCQLRVGDGRGQHLEPLAAASFDQGTHQQPVEQALRFAVPNLAVEPPSVGAGPLSLEGDAARIQLAQDLLEVLQLLPGQARQRGLQKRLLGILKQQSQRRACCLLLAVGVIDQHLTPQEAAAMEAWEEAGVRGEIPAEPIGSYSYRKWGGICQVSVFALRVTECAEEWPESGKRDRVWLSPRDAREKATLPEVREIIGAFANTFAREPS